MILAPKSDFWRCEWAWPEPVTVFLTSACHHCQVCHQAFVVLFLKSLFTYSVHAFTFVSADIHWAQDFPELFIVINQFSPNCPEPSNVLGSPTCVCSHVIAPSHFPTQQFSFSLCSRRWIWISSSASSSPDCHYFCAICQCCYFPLHCFSKSIKGTLNRFHSHSFSLKGGKAPLSSVKEGCLCCFFFLSSTLNIIICVFIHFLVKFNIDWKRQQTGKACLHLFQHVHMAFWWSFVTLV